MSTQHYHSEIVETALRWRMLRDAAEMEARERKEVAE